MLSEAYDVRSFTAVGTYDFLRGRPTFYDQGFSFQLDGTGNYEGKVLASNFDSNSAGLFTDITSSIFGAATYTQAAKGWYKLGVMHNAIRFNVTSVQAAKCNNVVGSWT